MLNFVISNDLASYDYLVFFLTDAWVPARSAQGEYLQIELNDVTSVYGLELEGSADLKSYVSSLLVMYSDDGHIYHQYVSKQNTPKVTKLKLPYNKKTKIIKKYVINFLKFRCSMEILTVHLLQKSYFHME